MKGYSNLENKGLSVKFHWSREVLVITLLSLSLIIGVTIHLLFIQWPDETGWLKYVIAGSFFAIIIVCYGYAPLCLSVDDRKVSLKKGIGSLEIPLTRIRSVTEIPKTEIRGSIRTFGSGGLFGFWGRFRNNRLGHYIMYATEWDHLILIRTDNKKYVFSCRRTEEFIAAVMKSKK